VPKIIASFSPSTYKHHHVVLLAIHIIIHVVLFTALPPHSIINESSIIALCFVFLVCSSKSMERKTGYYGLVFTQIMSHACMHLDLTIFVAYTITRSLKQAIEYRFDTKAKFVYRFCGRNDKNRDKGQAVAASKQKRGSMELSCTHPPTFCLVVPNASKERAGCVSSAFQLCHYFTRLQSMST
jgi:hypothetical protein